jgi:gas vesicle protein
MGNAGAKNRAKDWVRLAAKLSLILTDPKVRSAIGDGLKGHVDDVTDTVSGKYDDVKDTVSSKYEDAVDRFEAAAAAIQGKRDWPSTVTGFLVGVGIGAGLGILLAPAAGAETRDVIRDRAADLKDKVFGSAAAASDRIHRSVTSMPPTGTER